MMLLCLCDYASIRKIKLYSGNVVLIAMGLIQEEENPSVLGYDMQCNRLVNGTKLPNKPHCLTIILQNIRISISCVNINTLTNSTKHQMNFA